MKSPFSLELEAASGQLVRRAPTTIPLAAAELAGITGLSEVDCRSALRSVLQAGSRAAKPGTGWPLFAFRLHQFLSKGDTVHVSAEPEDVRYITDSYQVSVPGEPDKALLPLGFCRERGQEYVVVAKAIRNGRTYFVSRRDADASGGDNITGYLYISADLPWPDHPLTPGRCRTRGW